MKNMTDDHKACVDYDARAYAGRNVTERARDAGIFGASEPVISAYSAKIIVSQAYKQAYAEGFAEAYKRILNELKTPNVAEELALAIGGIGGTAFAGYALAQRDIIAKLI